MNPFAKTLTREHIDLYQRNGFLVVRRLYTRAQMAEWKERILIRMRQEKALDEPSGVRVWMAEALDPFLRERMADECVLSVLRDLVGPNIEFLSSKPVFKNATHTFASPWHQDWFYWKGAHKISIWIALDPADEENGCLQMIPGSHRQVYEMEEVNDGHGFGRRVSEKNLRGLPVETLGVDCGDAVFFHDLTLHASHPNSSGRDRWSFISTYRDGSLKDEATVWKRALLICGHSVNGARPFAEFP